MLVRDLIYIVDAFEEEIVDVGGFLNLEFDVYAMNDIGFKLGTGRPNSNTNQIPIILKGSRVFVKIIDVV